MDQSDTDAIKTFLSGDADALGVLVEKYKKPLYSFIIKMTEGKEDADEIFQETWFRAMKSLPKFRHDNFLSWMFRIARNLIIDRSRRSKHSVSMQQQCGNEEAHTLEDHLPAPGLSPAEEAGGSGIGQAINSALQYLSSEQKEVFILRMQSGLSFKEIAKIQRCSINTCLARMQYATGKLRSMLKEEYEEVRGA